ncbi:MAG: hypothetical protein ACYC63_12290 [Armatimonadota bacterium]
MEESTRALQSGLLSGLWPAAVGVAFFAILGYVSWRVLREMPEFPEKTAMLRGASWGAPAFAGLLAISFGVMWFGTGVGLMMTAFGLGKAIFWTGFALFMHRFRLESDGLVVGASFLVRYRRLGWEKWLEDWRKGQVKVQRYNRILVFWWAVLILLWLAFAGWGYWRVDRDMLAFAADERLGMALKQQLGDPRMVEVVPMRWGFEGPLYPLKVGVTSATTPEQGKQLAEQTRQLMARRGERSAMAIYVRPSHGHTLAKLTYAPPGMVLPEGIEKRRPRPRR